MNWNDKMAYSKDFRQKVLLIREKRGLSLLETAELFGVGVASLFRWTKKPEPSKTRNYHLAFNYLNLFAMRCFARRFCNQRMMPVT